METESCKRELLIEIPADQVQREADTVTAEYARSVRIPGFRPGHAPRQLVKRRFHEEIKSDVVQALVPKFFDSALKDQKLSLVGQPRFEDLKFEDDQPLTVKATFEVYPEFELKEYKGLEVEESFPPVTDANVDEAVEHWRDRLATFEPITDRPATDGDHVMVSSHSWQADQLEPPAGEPREGMIEVGGAETVPEFSEQLRGSVPGDVREFNVDYPQDAKARSLAGKTIRYRMKVVSVTDKVVPPADDELAKSAGEFATLAEFREHLRQEMEEESRKRAEEATRQKLVDLLVAANPFPIPETLVQGRVARRMESELTWLAASGVDLAKTNFNWEKLRESLRPEAEKDVRGALILGKVADAEQIEVSEEELDQTIREMAARGRETPAALKSRLTRDDELDRLRSTRRGLKALDFIYQNAKIIRKDQTVDEGRKEEAPGKV